MESRPSGQLFDIGYQRYDGPRQGRNRARLALFVSGVRQSLGLGRGGRSKILPVLMVLVSIVPAAVILVIATITGNLVGAESRPVELGDYFPINTLLLMIVAAILAPGLIVPDRTENVLSLYLVRPMGIVDYLAGRWLAFFLVTTVIIVTGPLLLLAGYILLSDNAAQEFRDNWLDFPKVLLAAAAMGAFITSIPMAVAAFTPRRVYAAAVVIGGVLVLSTAIAVLIEDLGTSTNERPMTAEERESAESFRAAVEDFPADTPPEAEIFFDVTLESGETNTYRMSREEVSLALDEEGPMRRFETTRLLDREASKWVVFGDPTGATVFITDLLFEDVETNTYRELVAEHPDYYPVAAYFAWMLIPLGLMWWRYRRYAA